MSTHDDLLSVEIQEQLKEKGISVESALSQIATFKNGIPPTKLLRPCTVGDGIENIDSDLEKYVGLFEKESMSLKVIKFVPASGAASRMFKELLSINSRDKISRDELNREDSKDSNVFTNFIDNIKKFAFYQELSSLMKKDGLEIDSLLDEGSYNEIAQYMLQKEGLNYSNLPKGIIQFHKYGSSSRTAFEEHLVEARVYSCDGEGTSRLHFTVSPEHLDRVEDLISKKVALYHADDTSFDINYSIQKPSTDTMAVDMDNRPFLDGSGNVVFRPGGHGALIENLNDLNCDIAFIKNIDNVVPDQLKGETYLYKKALGGYLLDIQSKMFGYLHKLDEDQISPELLSDIAGFMKKELKLGLPKELEGLDINNKIEFVRSKLDRPIRVCGVVKNVGEPGGGPFWIRSANGQISKQIVESAQVDINSSEQKIVWESSTHFNPVDLICGLKNYKGESFDLREYIDPDMGFISYKSSEGRDLKALELPGLWNGAMADWNSLFVEVPLITFNPVKGILDLLRPEHQPDEL